MKIFNIVMISMALTMPLYVQADKHIIGCQVGAGLFYNFLGVVNNLIWCTKNNVNPVVYWGSHTLYYDKNGYQGKENVWEYYFEPVSNELYNPSDKVWDLNKSPDDNEIRPVEVARCCEYEKDDLRQEAGSVIDHFIKVRPYIQKKIDAFYQANMAGKKTIGIHLRGTDKRREVKPIKLKDLTDLANKMAQNYPNAQFLVATDEEALLKEAISLLNRKVIYYDAYRSKDGVAIHWDKRQNRPKLGEEVVVEAYLLSRCDFFLHTCSSVSTAVIFINPDLPHQMVTTK